MNASVTLASGSSVRAKLLHDAGVEFDVVTPRVDEDTIKAALLQENAKPRDIADTLAEMKSRKVSDKRPGNFVIGCDQVLDCNGVLLSKPETPEDARSQLNLLRNTQHMLLSAAVIYQDGQPIWRHIGQVRLKMRDFSNDYLDAYIERNWNSIRHSVGAYKLEEEGVRLFSSVEGDYFNVLGLPLLQLLNFLALRGVIDS